MFSLFIFSCDSNNDDDNYTNDFDTDWTYDGLCEQEGFYYLQNIPLNIECKDSDFNTVECEQCFYYDDLLFLNDIILNSQNGTNPPQILPQELGVQYWKDGRLSGFISISDEKLLSIYGTYPFDEDSDYNDYLMDYTLSGEIPNSINSLDSESFRTLVLSYNSLSSSIPYIGNFPYMDTFDLSFNELSGNFPDGINNMLDPDIVNLSFNQLSGSFPDILGFVSVDVNFSVSNNQLTGTLPINICTEDNDHQDFNLSSLRLRFDNNNFTNVSGDICDYLDQLTEGGLLLGGNNLCENIPICISSSDNFNLGFNLGDSSPSTINQDCP